MTSRRPADAAAGPGVLAGTSACRRRRRAGCRRRCGARFPRRCAGWHCAAEDRGTPEEIGRDTAGPDRSGTVAAAPAPTCLTARSARGSGRMDMDLPVIIGTVPDDDAVPDSARWRQWPRAGRRTRLADAVCHRPSCHGRGWRPGEPAGWIESVMLWASQPETAAAIQDNLPG